MDTKLCCRFHAWQSSMLFASMFVSSSSLPFSLTRWHNTDYSPALLLVKLPFLDIVPCWSSSDRFSQHACLSRRWVLCPQPTIDVIHHLYVVSTVPMLTKLIILSRDFRSFRSSIFWTPGQLFCWWWMNMNSAFLLELLYLNWNCETCLFFIYPRLLMITISGFWFLDRLCLGSVNIVRSFCPL